MRRFGRPETQDSFYDSKHRFDGTLLLFVEFLLPLLFPRFLHIRDPLLAVFLAVFLERFFLR